MRTRCACQTFAFLAVFLVLCGCRPAPVPKKPSGNPSNPQSQSPKGGLAFDRPEAAQDPFNDPNGPYYHQVFKAASDDGLTFTSESSPLMDKGSVPDAVRLPDGRIFVYAVDGAGRSRSGVRVAVSKDDGATFEQGSAQISTSQGQGPGVADPQAVLMEDGRIRLFYVVFPAKKPPLDPTGKPIPTGDKIKIKSALSKDGINFKEEKGSRYETTEIVTDPDIVKIGDRWFMYLAKGMEQIVATSDDGDTFATEGTIRDDGAISKTVPIGEGKYRQFFVSAGIRSAVTTDGLNFVDDPGVRLDAQGGKIVADPSPVQIGDKWILFYKVAPPRDEPR